MLEGFRARIYKIRDGYAERLRICTASYDRGQSRGRRLRPL
jgi:hypothetical protein